MIQTHTLRVSLCALFCVCFSFFAFSQEATLRGIITDTENQEPLIGATLQLNGQGTVTDYDGSYRIIVPAGDYEAKITYVGYETQSRKLTLTAGENTADFTLSEVASILNTATVTAGKFEKPLGEVTVSLEVIKPALLENNNTTSVEDVLGKVSGVEIIDGQANIRGGSGYSYGAGSRVLLLVDDLPILQPDAGFPNWNDVPIENIEQIEVVKGAASALYGSSAMNGIINIRTGYARAEPKTQFSTFGIVYDGYEDEQKNWWKVPDSLAGTAADTLTVPHEFGFSALHKQKFGKFDLVVGGFYIDRKLFRKDEFTRYGRFNFNTRYRITDRLSFGLNGNLNAGESQSFFYWSGNGAGTTIGNPGSDSSPKRLRYNLDPHLDYYADNGLRHRFRGRFYHVDNSTENNQSNGSKLFYGEYQVQQRFTEIDMTASAGIVGQASTVRAELYGDTLYTANNLAAYLQLDKKFFDRLNVSAGFRYERNVLNAPDEIIVENDTLIAGREAEGRPVFRLGANYQAGQATFIRASFGQGYRFPTIAEKYIRTNVGFPIGENPELGSEQGYTAELGVKQGFKIRNWTGFVDAAAFYSRYTDMMEFNLISDPSLGFAFRSINVGNTEIRGLDVSIGGQGKIGNAELGIIGGYTYIDPQYQDFDPEGNGAPFNRYDYREDPALYNAATSSAEVNILKYRFRHTFKMDAQLDYKRLSFGAAVAYTSFMESIDALFLDFIPGLRDYREENNEGITLVDFRFGYQITDAFKFSFLAKNVMNKEYIRRPAQIEAPRNFTLRADYVF